MNIDFTKQNGLVPVIIQDELTFQVLMLGYMSEEAYLKTVQEGKVTFFSRSKNRLWTKGESSGNYLLVKDIQLDCDQDTLLIRVSPSGPVCHTGNTSCFTGNSSKGFIYALQDTIARRIDAQDENSYTYRIFRKGINKITQKVGEEAVELVIEALGKDAELFKNEAADLLYHFLILLKAKGLRIEEVEEILEKRSQQ